MKKVLITGATGFIGRHCLSKLLSRDYDVHAVTSKVPEEGSDSIHWHRIDLLDKDNCSNLIAKIKPSHLLHLAWYMLPGKCWNSPENFRWLHTSVGMLQSFAEHGGKRVVMAGTCAEYDWNYGSCSENTTPLKPSTIYGASKHSLQMILDVFSRLSGVSSAWGRVFFLYGLYEHPDRLVSSVIVSLLQGKPALCSHGNQVRDYLYTEDAADAFISLLDSEVKGGVNIASGYPVALKDIVYNIGHKLHKTDLIRLGAISPPEDEPRILIADVKRLADEVGWSPKYSLDQGLNNAIEWWQNTLRL
jgi:nucleoside-diphosphate-sugar epimerase